MLFQIGEFFANCSRKPTVVGHPMKHLSRTKRLLEIEVGSRERLQRHRRENSPQRHRAREDFFREGRPPCRPTNHLAPIIRKKWDCTTEAIPPMKMNESTVSVICLTAHPSPKPGEP